MFLVSSKKNLKSLFLFLIFFAFFVLISVFPLDKTKEAKSALGEIYGYAWIGADCNNPKEENGSCIWPEEKAAALGQAISFNCNQTSVGSSDTCSTNFYKVVVEDNGNLSGKAWVGAGESGGKGIGWLDFDNNAAGAPGGGEAARINPATGEMQGWAPIVSYEDRNGDTILEQITLAWIKFKGTAANNKDYGVKINSNGKVKGNNRYAWSGWGADTSFPGFGWIDFKDIKFPVLSLPPEFGPEWHLVNGYGWIGANCTDPNEKTGSCVEDLFGHLGLVVSFNCEQMGTCNDFLYGVKANINNGELAGMAWIGASDDKGIGREYGIGWIDFDYSGPAIPPGPGGFAKFNTTTGEMQGWAPIVSYEDLNGNGKVYDPGEDIILTWVKFKGKANDNSEYGARICLDDFKFGSFVWSGWGADGGFGWIKLGNVLTFTATNAAVYDKCNDQRTQDRVVFTWSYTPSGTQDKYQIQIDNNSDFSSPEFNETVKSGNTSFTAYLRSAQPYGNPGGGKYLEYNTTYYWHVRVWGSDCVESNWSATKNFTTTIHKYPFFRIVSSANFAQAGDEVKFEIKNIDAEGNITWSWSNYEPVQSFNFDESTLTATIKFDYPANNRMVSLTGTDSDGLVCTRSVNINLSKRPPCWCEQGACSPTGCTP